MAETTPNRVSENLGNDVTAETVDVDVSQPTAKKRGRPPGSKTGASRKKASSKNEAKKTNPQHVVGLHKMLAVATGVPEFEINEAEGQALAEAMDAVASEYDIAVSGKAAAMLQLIGTAGLVYYPRVSSIASKVKAKKAAAQMQEQMQGDASHTPPEDYSGGPSFPQ